MEGKVRYSRISRLAWWSGNWTPFHTQRGIRKNKTKKCGQVGKSRNQPPVICFLQPNSTPLRLHNLLEQHWPLGAKCCNTWDYGGHFIFKPRQVSSLNFQLSKLLKMEPPPAQHGQGSKADLHSFCWEKFHLEQDTCTHGLFRSAIHQNLE